MSARDRAIADRCQEILEAEASTTKRQLRRPSAELHALQLEEYARGIERDEGFGPSDATEAEAFRAEHPELIAKVRADLAAECAP